MQHVSFFCISLHRFLWPTTWEAVMFITAAILEALALIKVYCCTTEYLLDEVQYSRLVLISIIICANWWIGGQSMWHLGLALLLAFSHDALVNLKIVGSSPAQMMLFLINTSNSSCFCCLLFFSKYLDWSALAARFEILVGIQVHLNVEYYTFLYPILALFPKHLYHTVNGTVCSHLLPCFYSS